MTLRNEFGEEVRIVSKGILTDYLNEYGLMKWPFVDVETLEFPHRKSKISVPELYCHSDGAIEEVEATIQESKLPKEQT